MENVSFNLKIKEFQLASVDFALVNDILYNKDSKELLGCKFCYNITPEPIIDGFRIPLGNLINVLEAYPDYKGPDEIKMNMWLCPHCNKLFQELLPNFEYIGENNVSL